MDPDPDTDSESTNVPISKLRIETKPKRFYVFQNLKWNVSIYSKNFGTKPKRFDLSQNFLKQFFLQVLLQPQLALSQPLKHSHGLCSLQALNWLVIGNSQLLSHGCERVVEAVS